MPTQVVSLPVRSVCPSLPINTSLGKVDDFSPEDHLENVLANSKLPNFEYLETSTKTLNYKRKEK